MMKYYILDITYEKKGRYVVKKTKIIKKKTEAVASVPLGLYILQYQAVIRSLNKMNLPL